MAFPSLHRWDLAPRDAIDLQTQLASRIVLKDDPGEIQTIAGADLSLDPRTGTGFAGVIVFEFKTLREIERVSAKGALTFPYIPGLLSFREGPILLQAFEKLKSLPDVILFDGQGVAHPRRLGIASHMGLILDKPTVGCGKSLLCGTYQEPGPYKGDRAPLKEDGAMIGTVLRTRDRVRPIFVSPGHKMSHEMAVSIALHCTDGYRIPKPTRLADQFAGSIKSI